MYEVHQNFADQWVLYQVREENFDAIAWFLDREDAEFACAMFKKRKVSCDGEMTVSRTR